LVNQLNIYV